MKTVMISTKSIKKPLALWLGFFLATTLVAQNDAPKKVRMGIIAAPAVNWFATETNGISSNGSKLGFSYGLMTDFVIFESGNYFLSTGVNINDFGGRITFPDLVFPTGDTGVSYQGNAAHDYSIRQIEIPLTVKMVSSDIGHINIYGQFGLNLGFTVRAKRDSEYSYAGKTLTETDVEVLNKEISGFRTALNLGAGVEYDMIGSLKWFAGVQYLNGFTNILKGNYYEIDAAGVVLTDPAGSNTPKQGPAFKSQSNAIAIQLGLIF